MARTSCCRHAFETGTLPWYNESEMETRERSGAMEDCLLIEIQEARARGEDVMIYLARLERCRADHDVQDCDICRTDGLLPAQECVFKVYNLGVRAG